MSLKKYDVTINGTKTTLLLSDEDAERMGLVKSAEPAEKVAPAPENKARKAPNKKR